MRSHDRILVAALEVLRRHEGEEATVADILQEAGLSTRAFYRHFGTKEDVVRALYERDARSFGGHLLRRVEAAGDPEEALATGSTRCSAWSTTAGVLSGHRRSVRPWSSG